MHHSSRPPGLHPHPPRARLLDYPDRFPPSPAMALVYPTGSSVTFAASSRTYPLCFFAAIATTAGFLTGVAIAAAAIGASVEVGEYSRWGLWGGERGGCYVRRNRCHRMLHGSSPLPTAKSSAYSDRGRRDFTRSLAIELPGCPLRPVFYLTLKRTGNSRFRGGERCSMIDMIKACRIEKTQRRVHMRVIPMPARCPYIYSSSSHAISEPNHLISQILCFNQESSNTRSCGPDTGAVFRSAEERENVNNLKGKECSPAVVADYHLLVLPLFWPSPASGSEPT